MKITEKPIRWRGSTLKDIKDEKIFSFDARKEAGHQLSQVQVGLDPDDWRPFEEVGAGTKEIRINLDDGYYRVMYVAKFQDAIYVLHCFKKKSRVTSKEDKEIVGYKCPMDLFAGAIRIGAIFKRLDFDDTLYNSPDLRNVWHHLPKEIVETWKPIYKDKEKTQRELDNEEILRIEVEIMKSDKTISEYLIEDSYYIGKRTKK